MIKAVSIDFGHTPRHVTLFRLHHVDSIPIAGRRRGLELLTPLDIELAWMIVGNFPESLLKEGNGLSLSLGSIGL